MGITFAVDDVRLAAEPLETRRFGDVLREGAISIGADEGARVVSAPGVHPLLGAVHLAFSEHRPLVLSPDAIWLTIAQGVAHHVRRNAEALRWRLVRHDRREQLRVTWAGALPTSADGWQKIIDAFRAEVAERTGHGLARLLTCDFSTSTNVDRVASEIVLMDAVSPYFDFFLACVCGIPEVTLTGIPADWRKIRERIDVIEELDLHEWGRSLRPIADELVKASEGNPDIAMWRRIYKPREAYGWDRITGWIARLFPYLKPVGTVSYANPLLALPFAEPNDGDPTSRWYDGPGIALDDAPPGPSSVLLRVDDDVRGVVHEIELRGGLMGIAQEARGSLRPLSAFVVRARETSILDIIDRIVRDHPYQSSEKRELKRLPVTGTAEQLALSERIDAATLRFTGNRTWQLRPPREREHITVKLSDGMTSSVERWFDLPDGFFIGHLCAHQGMVYVLGEERYIAPFPPPPTGIDDVTGLPHPDPPIELWPKERDTSQAGRDFPVLGSSLAAILDYAFEHEGAVLPAESSTLDDYAVIPIFPRPAKR